MYSGSVAATGTGSCGAAAASAVAEIVVAAGRAAPPCALSALQDQAGVRLVRRQRDRRIEQRLVGTTRPGSSPQEAETITFGCASAMRAASSAAAKPPNTTEWIAPSRAQASMAIAASGTIGM